MTSSPLQILAAFLRLGCISFGGPVAHIGYFREEFVTRRRWLDDRTFAECIALTQLLPGPGSSQTGMLLGWIRGGPLGALAAWIGFTTPSAVAMAAIAIAAPRLLPHGPIHALLVVATAVVANAVMTMRAQLAPDLLRVAIALVAFAVLLAWHAAVADPVVIAVGAIAGTLLLRERVSVEKSSLDLHVPARAGIVAAIAFVALLFGLGAIATVTRAPELLLAGVLFRVGSLVFGGGHVVLPLLQSQLAAAGMLSNAQLLAGYAAAQAMPGPLFTIASYSGAAAFGGSLGWRGALVGTVAIFAPSFFLLTAIAPFYRRLSESRRFRAAMAGANSAVVGLLASALISPIATSAILSWSDAAGAALAFGALTFARIPAWVLVVAAAVAGALLPHGLPRSR